MSSVSSAVDRVEVIFDDPTLVADAGLIVPATLMVRLRPRRDPRVDDLLRIA